MNRSGNKLKGKSHAGEKKPKKMRKSSFNKVKKHFEVFNNSNENINRYADLPNEEDVDNRDVGDSSADDDDIYDPSKLTFDDDSDSDSDSDNEKDEDSSLQTKSTTATGNDVVDNTDFIGFVDSSSGEDDADESQDEEEDEEEGEEEGNEGKNGPKRIVNMDYPWILDHDHSTQKEVVDWLCMEITDFVAYVSPSKEEIEIRNRTISKLRAAVREFWPDADLLPFGSYATDLYLPGSDIDCVINSKNGDKDSRQALYSLSTFLKRKNLAQQMEVIANARVPIIKFVDPESLIHIDVSFERTNGVEAAKIIRGWLEEQQGLRELVLIIKQFLHARKLNSVYNGGLGGFTTICLVYSFLKLHPKILSNEIESVDNLGVLLIDFFELYGKNFAYDDVGISLKDEDSNDKKGAEFGYFKKRDYPELLRLERNSFTLCIQDPGDPTNNISRSSYNIRGIKKAFAGAFDLLTNRCYELYQASYKDRRGQSILGNVIKFKGKLREFKDERGLVENKAIVANELYIRKKRTIVEIENDEEDLEEDDDFYEVPKEPIYVASSDEEDQYHVRQPPKKRQKKNSATTKKSTTTTVISQTGAKSVVSKKKSDQMSKIMGFERDDDEDDQDDVKEIGKATKLPYGTPTNDEFNTDNEEEEDSYEPTKALPIIHKKSNVKKVDKDAKKEYWLNKGLPLA